VKPRRGEGVDSLRRSVESLTTELLTVYGELALLHSLGAKLGRLADQDSIAEAALQEALTVVQANSGWVALWDGEQFRLPAGACLQIEPETASHISRVVLEPLHLRRKDQLLSQAFAEEHGIRRPDSPTRLLACSLAAAESSLGYLCLGRGASGRIFTSVDQKLVGAVASFTAVALDNVTLERAQLEKTRLEQELEVARGVQTALLRADFRCCDFLEAGGASLPCQRVGGDYFDLIPMGPDRCLLAMADVSGKGPAAALQAALLQGAVYAATRRSVEPAELMACLNDCLRARGAPGHGATVFLGLVDRQGWLTYTNAGHPPPLWICRDGRVEPLGEGGPLLGFLESPVYSQGRRRMGPGDLLVLLTDGVTDAESAAGEKFGAARLPAWAARQAGAAPGDVFSQLLREVEQFAGGRPAADDVTVLAVRLRVS